jgi:ankyrin repeat protein
MAGKKPSFSIYVAAGIVLCLGNASAQSITELIEKNDVMGVETFAQTHDINELHYDYTPLCYAIKCNKESIVRLLIRSGADLEKECHGKTPLMFAAKSDFVQIIDLLIEAGSGINNPNQLGQTPLIYACKYGNLETAKHLISKGAAPGLKDNNGNTCLEYALKSPNKQLVNLLLEHGLTIPNIGNVQEGPHVRWLSDDQCEIIYLKHAKATNKTTLVKKIITSKELPSFVGLNPDVNISWPGGRDSENMHSYDGVSKILAIGDLHGEYDSFARLLINTNVIDDQLNWNWGKGHILICGDVFDRGQKVTECLWLIYKLQQQARQAGGAVHLILGNHEIIHLLKMGRGELATKYAVLFYNADLDYADFFGPEFELGRWLRASPMAVRISENLFVHGGIPPECIENELDIEKMNDCARTVLNNEDFRPEDADRLTRLAFTCTEYRGYFDQGGDYFRDLEGRIDEILKFYGVRHIIVGHTAVDEVTTLKGGRVVAIDVPFGADQVHEQSLLIENDRLYRIYADGRKETIAPDKIKTSIQSVP